MLIFKLSEKSLSGKQTWSQGKDPLRTRGRGKRVSRALGKARCLVAQSQWALRWLRFCCYLWSTSWSPGQGSRGKHLYPHLKDLFSREDKTCRSPPLVGHAELGSRGQESMNLALIWDSLLMCYNRNTHNLPAFCTSCEGNSGLFLPLTRESWRLMEVTPSVEFCI